MIRSDGKTYNMVDHSCRSLRERAWAVSIGRPLASVEREFAASVGRRWGLRSTLGWYHFFPSGINPKCRRKRGIYRRMEPNKASQSHKYSRPIRSLKNALPIQHQYCHAECQSKRIVNVTKNAIPVLASKSIRAAGECAHQTRWQRSG